MYLPLLPSLSTKNSPAWPGHFIQLQNAQSFEERKRAFDETARGIVIQLGSPVHTQLWQPQCSSLFKPTPEQYWPHGPMKTTVELPSLVHESMR